MDLENIFGDVVVCGENVGGSSHSGRIATTRRNCDRWCRFVTVCQFARVSENTQSGVMVCGKNVGGSPLFLVEVFSKRYRKQVLRVSIES